LQKLASNSKFINNSFDKTNAFIEKENNLYVIQQCLVPLVEILVRKNLLKPKKKQKELHNLLFTILQEYSKYPSIQSRLTHLFKNYRDLNEDDAEKVIACLGNNADIAHFIIYYTFYRVGRVKEKESFNADRFTKILKDKIKNGNDGLRRQIAWNLWRILDDDLDDNKDKFDKLKEFIDEYVSSTYSKEPFYFILKLIEDHIDDHYTICKNWLFTIFNGVFEFYKSLDEPKESNYVIPFEIRLSNILEVVVKHSSNDYIQIVSNICELAQLENVVLYDIKRVFEVYKLLPPEKREEILPELELLWDSLVQKNARLIEVDWKTDT